LLALKLLLQLQNSPVALLNEDSPVRLIALLLVMLVILFVVYKQTGDMPETEVINTPKGYDVNIPEAPSNPQDLQKFKGQMNDFIQDAAEDRKRRIEEETKK
jgi:hypothetical protein